jgi:hypothetical protein
MVFLDFQGHSVLPVHDGGSQAPAGQHHPQEVEALQEGELRTHVGPENLQGKDVQVHILPKVTKSYKYLITNVCNYKHFLTGTFYIFVNFNHYSSAGQLFCNHFEPIFEEYLQNRLN